MFGLFGTGWTEDERGGVELQWVGLLKSISNSVKLEKDLKPGNSYFYLQAYRWATKNRADGGRWSKACQGLDVCLLGQQASALGVTGEGQGAETLQVQMAPPAGWLEEVLAGNHLEEKTRRKDGEWSCEGGIGLVFFQGIGLPVAQVQV